MPGSLANHRPPQGASSGSHVAGTVGAAARATIAVGRGGIGGALALDHNEQLLDDELELTTASDGSEAGLNKARFGLHGSYSSVAAVRGQAAHTPQPRAVEQPLSAPAAEVHWQQPWQPQQPPHPALPPLGMGSPGGWDDAHPVGLPAVRNAAAVLGAGLAVPAAARAATSAAVQHVLGPICGGSVEDEIEGPSQLQQAAAPAAPRARPSGAAVPAPLSGTGRKRALETAADHHHSEPHRREAGIGGARAGGGGVDVRAARAAAAANLGEFDDLPLGPSIAVFPAQLPLSAATPAGRLPDGASAPPASSAAAGAVHQSAAAAGGSRTPWHGSPSIAFTANVTAAAHGTTAGGGGDNLGDNFDAVFS